MREAYRLQKNNLKNTLTKTQKGLVIFFIYTGKELPDYQIVFEKMGNAILRIEKIIENNG
jgi:hypothetical protein